MDIETSEIDDVTVLRPGDELDLLGYQSLAEKIDALLHEGCKKIVLDLGTVTYINSPVVNVLLGAAGKMHKAGATLALANVQGGARLVLETSGALKSLPIYATVGDAASA